MSDRIVFVLLCLRAELMLRLGDRVLHQNQCFTKKRKVGIFIFPQKGCLFLSCK